jgi:hypothetical protein
MGSGKYYLDKIMNKPGYKRAALFHDRTGTLLNEDATRRSDRPLPSHSGRIGFTPAS